MPVSKGCWAVVMYTSTWILMITSRALHISASTEENEKINIFMWLEIVEWHWTSVQRLYSSEHFIPFVSDYLWRPPQVLSTFILFTKKLDKFLSANDDKAEPKKPNFLGRLAEPLRTKLIFILSFFTMVASIIQLEYTGNPKKMYYQTKIITKIEV